MANNIKGISSFAYEGVNAVTPPNIRVLKRAPTTSDTKNVTIGDFWLNSQTEILYQLVNLANDTATWNEVATPVGVGTSFFDTDAGTAQDLNQRINLIGGANINTTGAGNTVTVILDNDVNISGAFTANNDISSITGNLIADAGNVLLTRTAANEGQIIASSTTVDTNSATLIFNKERNGAAIQANDIEGVISFQGFDGTTFIESAEIRSDVPATATIAAGQVAGSLIFATHPDAATALVDRMSIESDGSVIIDTADGSTGLQVFKPTTTSNAISASIIDNNANGVTIRTTKKRGAAAVQPSDFLGYMSFEGFDGTFNQAATYISGQVSPGSTVAAGRVAGRMSFWTAPDAASIALERMTLFENGALEIAFPDGALDTTLKVNGIRELQGIDGTFTGSGWFEGQIPLQTVGATATAILQLPVVDSQMILIKAQVSGFQDDFSDSIVADVFFGVYRPSGGNVTLIVTPSAPAPTIFSTSAATVDNIVDVGTQEARITVAGVALETYNWVCKYSYMYLVDNS
jgi:hypothetical protein